MSPTELYGPWAVAGYQVQIDFQDRVRLVASRDGTRLRALPPAVRAADDMAWMRLSLEAAVRHHADLRTLLETAMTEAIPLPTDDLGMLALDPVGRSMLGRLLVDVDGVIGRPLIDDWLMELASGDLQRLAAPFTVVHPCRLDAQRMLEHWDRWLNRQPFKQPFKQIRRELYRPSADDQRDGVFSRRFAGECVRWDQTRALLEGRGWYRVTKSGAERQFRRARLTAHLEFRTPATNNFPRDEVMLNRIFFLPQGEQVTNRGRPGISLNQVPARLFSETLRDVGLVSQVANQGSR